MPVQVRAGVAGESYLYKLCIYAGNENYINPDWTHKCDACLISFEWESAQSAKFNAEFAITASILILPSRARRISVQFSVVPAHWHP